MSLASAILRGRWLIQKDFADNHLPLIVAFKKGDTNAINTLLTNTLQIDRSLKGKLAAKIHSYHAETTNDNEDEEEDDDLNPANPEAEPIGNNVYEISPYTNITDIPEGSIAYVDIDGALLKQGGLCSWGMEDYAEIFYRLKYATNIDAVILDLDSPGGQCDGTASLGDSIKACAKVKPVIGFIDDGMAASAAYWVISACTEIYCSQPTDAAGSIGVYCTIADYYSYFAKEGLPVRDVYAPESTEKNQNIIQALDNKDDLLKEELSFIAKTFIATIKANRKGKIKGEDWATGKMYFAAEALALGLIDGIKGFDEVVKRTNSLIPVKNKNISSSLNDNNMAFEKIMATAGIPSVAVVEGGFLLQESDLNKVEAALAVSDASATTIATLTQSLATATTAKETAETNLATANATIATQIAEIATLKSSDGTKPNAADDATKEDAFANTKVDAMDMAFQKELIQQV